MGRRTCALEPVPPIETLEMFYGPMPVEMFLDKFLPAANATPDSVQDADFSNVPTYEGVLETDMYDPLVSTSWNVASQRRN